MPKELWGEEIDSKIDLFFQDGFLKKKNNPGRTTEFFFQEGFSGAIKNEAT